MDSIPIWARFHYTVRPFKNRKIASLVMPFMNPKYFKLEQYINRKGVLKLLLLAVCDDMPMEYADLASKPSDKKGIFETIKEQIPKIA